MKKSELMDTIDYRVRETLKVEEPRDSKNKPTYRDLERCLYDVINIIFDEKLKKN